MSFRHTHITEFLYFDNEDPVDVKEFIQTLKREFQDVYPNWGDYGRLGWIVMYSRDSDGRSEEIAWPERIKNLTGILQSHVKVVSAWEGLEDRQAVWVIPGRGQISVEEYLIKRDAQ